MSKYKVVFRLFITLVRMCMSLISTPFSLTQVYNCYFYSVVVTIYN
jgi:hypothetical protein